MILLSKGQHKFVLSQVGDVPGDVTILLDHTQFPETFLINYRKRFIEDEFISLNPADKFIEPVREFIGWDIFFAMDYSTSADVDLLFKIGQLEDLLAFNARKIFFQVRDDDDTFNSEVISITEDINLRLLFGDNAYEGTKLYFRSARTHKLLNWIKPIPPPPPGGEVIGGGSVFTPIEGIAET